MKLRQIKSWLEEVNKNNFPSRERQKELGWEEYVCSFNILDGKNRYTKVVLEKLNKDIQEEYAIGFTNTLQKENYGGTLTTYHLRSANRRNLDITKQDFTMMYRYNIYENGELIQEIEEVEDFIKWLNENL